MMSDRNTVADSSRRSERPRNSRSRCDSPREEDSGDPRPAVQRRRRHRLLLRVSQELEPRQFRETEHQVLEGL